MKSIQMTVVIGFMLILIKATSALADEPPGQGVAAQTPQLEIEKSGKEGLQSTLTQHKGEAGDIAGTKVVNNSGEEIGEIESIVRNKETEKFHAVVSVGGFLGIGDKEVAIPLSDLELQDEHFLALGAASEEDLKARPAYKKERYEDVSGEQMTDTVAEIYFLGLDADADGYLSKEEAKERAALTRQWDRVDQDRDDRIDPAEFSAFEASGPMGSPAY